MSPSAWLPPCSRIAAITIPLQERLEVRQALQALLAQLPADTLAARCVRPLQRYIDSCVAAGLGATRVQVGPMQYNAGMRRPVHALPTWLLGWPPSQVPAPRSMHQCLQVYRAFHKARPLPRGPRLLQVIMAGVLLDVLRQANEDAGGIIPYTGAQPRGLLGRSAKPI